MNSSLSFLSKENLKSTLHSSLILLMFVFQTVGISLAVLANKDIDSNLIMMAIGFILVSTTFNIFFKRIIKGEQTFFLLITFLYSISIVVLLRLDESVAKNHIMWYIIGLFLFVLVYFSYKYLDKYLQDQYILFFAITLLTFLATLLFGYSEGGAKNWISLGGKFSIQLSEFAKVSFILLIASFYKNIEKIKEYKFGEYYLVLASYVFSLLFFVQGELGTAMLFVALLISSMFVFERRYIFILTNIVLALIGVYLASLVLSHIKVRINIWLDPWADYNNKGYQVIQGLFSVANGGFFGTGIGLGSPTLVPVVQTDYILAAIMEEMGIFMGFAIILIYILIFYRAIKIALQFNSNYYSSISMSIGLLYSFQALIMFGGIMKLIPLTGITTPFLSYGGSSTMSNFILLAILQFITTKLGENYEQV